MKNTKRIKPRNHQAVAAHFRKAGPMKPRNERRATKRDWQKDEE